MLTSEFEERKKMISDYFHNDYKWKFKSSNDDWAEWEYQYYKGFKRNLDELNFICKIIFPHMEFVDGESIKNDKGDIIGAYIVGTEIINPNFNGLYQGTTDYQVYLVVCLCQYGMWLHQTTSQKLADEYIKEL